MIQGERVWPSHSWDQEEQTSQILGAGTFLGNAEIVVNNVGPAPVFVKTVSPCPDSVEHMKNWFLKLEGEQEPKRSSSVR
jgi:hypothetical protein